MPPPAPHAPDPPAGAGAGRPRVPREVGAVAGADAHDAAAAAFVETVRAIAGHLRAAARVDARAAAGLGVHGAALLALRTLAEAPAATLADLAARTQTDPSTASVVVRGLVAHGLVARTADPADRRRTPLALTVAGRRVVRQAPEPPHTAVARAAGLMEPAELRALTAQLTILLRGLAREAPGVA